MSNQNLPLDCIDKPSDTPRTDAANVRAMELLDGDYAFALGWMTAFAKQLEREATQLRCKLNESLNLHNRNLTDTAKAMQEDRRNGHHCDAHKVVGGVMDRSWVAIKIKA